MRLYAILIFLSFSLVSMAREKNDSISTVETPQEMEVKMSSSDFHALINAKDKAKSDLKSLQAKFNELQKGDSVRKARLSKIESDYIDIKAKYEKLQKSHEKSDIRLFNVASNFLYIPYEAYSVDSIAIYAYEAITSPNNKDDKIYALLKNYQKDIKAILTFMDSVEKDLDNPFAKEAKSWVEKLHSEEFYTRYSSNNHWHATYLGKKIVNIENQLNVFDGKTHKTNFANIKSELESCLKTVEDL